MESGLLHRIYTDVLIAIERYAHDQFRWWRTRHDVRIDAGAHVELGCWIAGCRRERCIEVSCSSAGMVVVRHYVDEIEHARKRGYVQVAYVLVRGTYADRDQIAFAFATLELVQCAAVL